MGMSVHEPAAAEYLPASHALHVAAAVAPAVCSERRQARSSTSAHARQSAACTAVLHVTTDDDAHPHPHTHTHTAHDDEQQQVRKTRAGGEGGGEQGRERGAVVVVVVGVASRSRSRSRSRRKELKQQGETNGE